MAFNNSRDFWAYLVKTLVFQVQPVTCCNLSVSFHEFEVHFIDSFEMIGNFPKVSNFNWLFLNSICSYVTSGQYYLFNDGIVVVRHL
jgi:hypothetical protein